MITISEKFQFNVPPHVKVSLTHLVFSSELSTAHRSVLYILRSSLQLELEAGHTHSWELQPNLLMSICYIMCYRMAKNCIVCLISHIPNFLTQHIILQILVVAIKLFTSTLPLAYSLAYLWILITGIWMELNISMTILIHRHFWVFHTKIKTFINILTTPPNWPSLPSSSTIWNIV